MVRQWEIMSDIFTIDKSKRLEEEIGTIGTFHIRTTGTWLIVKACVVHLYFECTREKKIRIIGTKWWPARAISYDEHVKCNSILHSVISLSTRMFVSVLIESYTITTNHNCYTLLLASVPNYKWVSFSLSAGSYDSHLRIKAYYEIQFSNSRAAACIRVDDDPFFFLFSLYSFNYQWNIRR